MKMKIFTCPECKFRKFESINALNVHIGKSHTVNYRIVMVNNNHTKNSKSDHQLIILKERSRE